MSDYPTIEYRPARYDLAEMQRLGQSFYQLMNQRRSVREFSPEPVPRDLIETAIATASTAPSGAHLQPWRFAAISDPGVKKQIRLAAEAEERESYEGGRMPQNWRDDLAPLGTNWQKPYLEIVPWIVVLFEETYRINPDGSRAKNYYVKESVGIACGLFLAAIHNMGLAALTHTPSPMQFLAEILGRPENERPFVLIPIGYPAPDCRVPDVTRKLIEDVAVWV